MQNSNNKKHSKAGTGIKLHKTITSEATLTKTSQINDLTFRKPKAGDELELQQTEWKPERTK